MTIWAPGQTIPYSPGEEIYRPGGNLLSGTVIPGQPVFTAEPTKTSFLKGDPGTPGVNGLNGLNGTSGNVITRVANGPLGGQRVLMLDPDGRVSYATNTSLEARTLSVGVSLGAVVDGSQISINMLGLMQDVSFAWTPGAKLYLGANGLLTQTLPTAPSFLRIIAVAVSATEIFIDPQPSIIII